MLVFTIGTVSSASTWTFNVVRCLLAADRPNVISIYIEHAADLLSNVPERVRDIVVKAHYADYPMLKLLELADARVVLTYRDPKDSIASQIERTGDKFAGAVESDGQDLRDIFSGYRSSACPDLAVRRSFPL